MTAIHLIIGTLQRMHVFGVENRDTLTHKATGVMILAFQLFRRLTKPDSKEALFLAVFCKALKEA